MPSVLARPHLHQVAKPPENPEVSSQDRLKHPLDTQGLSEQAALLCWPFHLRSTAYLVLVLFQ